jgi:hypothetical protein
MKTLFFLQHLIKYMELAAAVAGFMYWGKLKNSHFKWFPVYLAIISACEFTGYMLIQKGIAGNKQLYTLFVIPLEFLFLHWFYYRELNRQGKRIAISCSILFVFSLAAEVFLLKESKNFFFSLSYSIGNITLLVLSITYFVDLMKSVRIVTFYKELFFWVNVGVILFYLGTFPYYGLFNLLVKEQYNVFISLTWAMVILNNLMYLLFVTGFIWGKPKR